MNLRPCAEKGQFMKEQVSLYHVEVVEVRQGSDGVYTLLRITRGSLLKYAVEIEDRAGMEFACLTDAETECRIFFDRLVAGELSSLHLCEAASDFCCEHSLEIF